MPWTARYPEAAAPPAAVRYNDWRRIDLAPVEAFQPALTASVVAPYHEAPRALARTLAALERQTYPRELFEVVIVDDGSRAPLERPPSSPLAVTVVRQQRRGFGLARARNAGARAAAGDILVFLDGDMLPEANWLAAHARWHHAAGDVLTQGFYAYVDVDGVEPEAIRRRPGTLGELLAGRPADGSFIEPHMARTHGLTDRDDTPFRIVSGGNLGVGRAFFELAGGFDESFTRWGGEDTEFGWRACNHGGVLAPVPAAFCWHQGRAAEDRARKSRSQRLQRARLAHLVAHHDFRDARPGGFFAVPRFVVTLVAGDAPADRVVDAVERLLADPVPDLVVRVALPASAAPDDARREWLRNRFDPDPRVRVAPAAAALDEFPAAPFHVALPAGARFARGLVRRLHRELGPAAVAEAAVADGSRVSITRAWALHRARRTGGRAADFGDVLAVPARRLRLAAAPGPRMQALCRRLGRLRVRRDQLRLKIGSVRSPRRAAGFLAWLAGAAWRRLARRRRRWRRAV